MPSEPGTTRDWAVLTAEGALDVRAGTEFVQQVTRLVEDGSTQVVLDLGGVVSVAPSGFGALITCLRITREAGGDFRLACVYPPLDRVFHRHRIDRIFRLHGSVQEAIAAGQPSSRSVARRRRLQGNGSHARWRWPFRGW